MMEYNNVTLKKAIKMLRQNAERIPGLVFTGAGPPDTAVPGKSNGGRNAFPPAGPRNRTVGRYSTKNYL
jgi:hypothetical protein